MRLLNDHCVDFFPLSLAPGFELGAIVFFRINNSNCRNTILEKLVEKVHGESYKVYWHGENAPGGKHTPGLFRLIRKLDQERNQIVHWHVMASIDLVQRSATTKLIAPNFWSYRPESTSLDIDNLVAFAMKSDFVYRSINMFHWMTSRQHPISDAERAPWLEDIFQKPAIYPPPDTHPLSANYKEGAA